MKKWRFRLLICDGMSKHYTVLMLLYIALFVCYFVICLLFSLIATILVNKSCP